MTDVSICFPFWRRKGDLLSHFSNAYRYLLRSWRVLFVCLFVCTPPLLPPSPSKDLIKVTSAWDCLLCFIRLLPRVARPLRTHTQTHTPAMMHLFANFTNNLFAWSQLFYDKSHPSNVIFCRWQSNQIAAMQVKWHVHLMLIFSSSLMPGTQNHERITPMPIFLLVLKPSISASNNYTCLDVEYQGTIFPCMKKWPIFFFSNLYGDPVTE